LLLFLAGGLQTMHESHVTRIEPTERVQTVPNPHEIHPTISLLTSLMDDFIQIPGTNIRIGLDGIIGLFPVVGDLLTLVVAAVFMKEAERLGVSRWTKARMYGNYLIDTVIGIIPIAGDAFDFAFKAHRRNLRLLQEHLDKHPEFGGMAKRYALSWRSVLWASVTASAAMSLFMFVVPQWLGIEDMDLGLAFANFTFADGSVWAFLSRALIHLGGGAVGVVLYAVVMRYLETQSSAASGAAFGAFLWLFGSMLLLSLVMKLWGMPAGPMNPGFFMLELGHGWAPALVDLIAYLLHGTVAGVVYKHRILSEYWVGDVRYVAPK
jgi:hypothetical protein